MLFKDGLWTKWLMLIRNESWTFLEEPIFRFGQLLSNFWPHDLATFSNGLLPSLMPYRHFLNAVWKPILLHKLHGFLSGISGRTLFLKKVDIIMPTVLKKKIKIVKANSETWLLNWLAWEMSPSPNAIKWKLLVLSPAKAVSRKVLKTLSVLIGKK